MAIASPALLALTARILGTSTGLALSRRSFLSLMERPLPLLSLEAMASRKPDRIRVDLEPFLDARVVAPLAEGPLSGEKVAIKDSLDVAGLTTGLGLPVEVLPADHHGVRRDSVLVDRIRRAGGAIAGKAKMTELGMDGIGALMPGVMPGNPVAPGYIPGGSSTGTAIAVATGAARFGVGGDGLGSVRIPAAFHGLVGLKPGRDVLSLEGYRSVAPTMDVPGPIARDVADCALLFQILIGAAPHPVAPVAPRRVGLIAGAGPELATADVRRAFHRALDAAGIPRRIVEVAGAAHHGALSVAASTAELAQSAYADLTRSGQGVLNVALGRSMGSETAAMEAARQRLREGFLRALSQVDAIAMPTTALPPPALTHGLFAGGQDLFMLRAIGAYTPLANLTGLPAIAVPCGVDGRGRPLSLMLMGPPGSELRLLEMAAALEATGLGKIPI